MKKHVLLAKALMFMAFTGALTFESLTSVYAQVATTYTFSQSEGTYTPITGGTVIATATLAVTQDDVIFNSTIPFNFVFDGNVQTAVRISTNGFLTFGTTNPANNSYVPLSATTAYAGAVSPFGRDLQGGYATGVTRTSGSNICTVTNVGPITVGSEVAATGFPAGTTVTAISGNTLTMSNDANATGTNVITAFYGSWSNIRVETLGVAPNRIYVVQWQNWKRFGITGANVQDMVLNFQVRLYEADNDIEIVYGNCSPGVTTFTTVNEVGLRGPNNTFATNVNNRRNVKNTNDNWLNSTPGTANNSGMLFNNVAPANVIPNGLTYKWDAPAPPACSNVTLGTTTGITFSSATLNWTAATGPEDYQIEFGVSPYTFTGTPTISTTGGNLSQVLSSLNASTAYQFRIRSVCAGNEFGNWSVTGTFTTPAPPPANDDCSNAITLNSCIGAPQSLLGSTINATVDAIYSNCGAGGNNTTERGVWYKYIGDDNQVTINTCNPSVGYDTRITVYSGSCGTLTCVAGNDDAGALCTVNGLRSEVVFNALAGTEYLIFVHGFQSGTSLSAVGQFGLNWSCSPLCLPIPSNETCASAQSLTLGNSFTPTAATNNCASADFTTNPSCFSSFATLPDLWYSFTTPAGVSAVSLRIDLTAGAGNATSMGYAVFSGSCGALSQIACNSGVTSGATNNITGLAPETTYYVAILSPLANRGAFEFGIWVPVAPTCASNFVVTPTPGCDNEPITVSWDAVPGATAYIVSLGTTPGGTDIANNQNIGNLLAFTLTDPDLNSTYYYTVTPTNIAGNAVGCVEQQFTTGSQGCVCTPVYSSGKTAGDLISNVAIPGTTLSNNTGTAQTNPAFTYFTGAPNLTANLIQGGSYNVNISVGTWGNQHIRAWIDYNGNGIFEDSETIGSTIIGAGLGNVGSLPPAVFPINLALNAPLGTHRMRIRNVWQSSPSPAFAAAIDPCILYSFGETEDYDITIVAPTLTQLGANSCNATNVALDQGLFASLVGAPAYRFRIVGANNANWVNNTVIVDRTVRWFSFNPHVTGEIAGQTYTVEVAVGDGFGNFGPYGNACNVTLGALPTTQLTSNSCNAVNVLPSTALFANQVQEAQGYRFRIVGANNGDPSWDEDTIVVTRPVRWFRFDQHVPGFVQGSTYQVRVAYLTNDGVTYSPYGPVCSVALFAPLEKPSAANNDIFVDNKTMNVVEFGANASHNPFTTDFGIQVLNANDVETINVSVYDMSGKLIERNAVNPMDIESARFGANLASGMYMIEVRQGSNQAVIRQVKN